LIGATIDAAVLLFEPPSVALLVVHAERQPTTIAVKMFWGGNISFPY
jgi:hypothetical protein